MINFIIKFQNAIGHIIGIVATALIIMQVPVYMPAYLYFSLVAFVVWIMFELVQAEAAIRSDYFKNRKTASLFACILRYQWKESLFKDVLGKNLYGLGLSIIVLGFITGWK